ncbi:DUF3465 domain-containing protein [Shewanella psychrotolerans]|uniref:DUF3465 domain-containing protein n=1 Tax=Shewanella psychrotolerans TaxID=2864206 RepID=UPI001C65D60F|nr:DUF3465 domain-containing protein [Shewanella psychrotolerans]QYK00403.1 DUF3465 domain-containing protein [Shewanella psychrotolerans]
MTASIRKGTLVRWKDDKGYGFIKVEPSDSQSEPDELFIHAKTLRHMSRRPVVGDMVYFQIEAQPNGKRAAINARIDGVAPHFVDSNSTAKAFPSSDAHSKQSVQRTTKHKSKRKHSSQSPLIGIVLRILVMILLLALGSELYQRFWFTPDETTIEAGSTLADTANIDGKVNADSVIASAFELQQSGVMVQSQGRVTKLLADDNEGSRHQKFILRLSTGQTLLVAHNIDLAPRIDSLNVGDNVSFSGQYEWNSRGGVVHWTHHDPKGHHQGGWLRHNGCTYQ